VTRIIDAFDKKKKNKKKLDDDTVKLLTDLKEAISTIGIAGLQNDAEKRSVFLKNATKIAENETVRKLVSEFYAKSGDLALSHFANVKPEMFDEDYEFIYEDVLYSGSIDGPDMVENQDLYLWYKEYPIHMVVLTGELWETMNLPDSPFQGPYSVIVVVPLDEFVRNDRPDKVPKEKIDPAIAEEEKKLEKMLADSKKSKEDEAPEVKEEEKKVEKKKEKKKKKKKGEDDEENKKSSKNPTCDGSSASLSSGDRWSSASLRVSSQIVKKGFSNKLTNSLGVIERLRNSQSTLLRKADNVVLLLSHYDLFLKLKPEDGSIKDSFPDFCLEENSKNILNYITDVFEDSLHCVCANKVRSTSCCFLDAADIERTVLPHLFDITDTTIRLHQKKLFSAKTDAMVNRAKELCSDKPIPIPFNAETMHMTLQSGEISDIGKRKANEDALVVIDDYKSDKTPSFCGRVSFYAVFDGHGGSYVSNNCAKCVHKMLLEHPAFPYDPKLAFVDTFRKVDAVVTAPEDKSGSTGLCCVIYESNLYLGNVGDSECVLGSREASKGRFRATLLSKKHNPTEADEKKRILDMGGSVVFGRVFGTLAVSRGFGDMTYKQPGKEFVSVEPHVEVRALDRTCHFVILGCDGLWDTVSYDLAVKTVGEVFDRGEGPDVAAKALCDLTQSRGSQDNVSIIVVYFRWSRK